MTSLLVQTTATTETPTPIRRRGGGLWTAVRTNRKAMIGLVIFLLFSAISIAPQLFTSVRHPTDAGIFTPALGPSGAHWLGTTSLGQDIYAELIYGTRE